MRIVLWDNRRHGVAKDFAGGFGVGQLRSSRGLWAPIVSTFFARDYRPVALQYAYLASAWRSVGHTVEYSLDGVPPGADVYVFNPALATLDLERRAMETALVANPHACVFAVGALARAMPEAFAGLEVKIVDGEAEQLCWKLDEVLTCDKRRVSVGFVRDLDTLPVPDWQPFQPRRFRVAYDFWKFPTAYIEASRGCTFTCNYCPYIAGGSKMRFRSPSVVAEEMRLGIERYGFRSFKFRDPLFGLDRPRALELAERIAHLPGRVQFSIETRADLLHHETLRALQRAGLTSVTFGVETPDRATLEHHHRQPIADDRQKALIERCRQLGVRTVAGFMIGFPDDTVRSIRDVARYARWLNPTYANFNLVTPYPGTEFHAQVREQIATFDHSQYDVYTPVLRYAHLTPAELERLRDKCFASYYFRWPYLRANARLLWPAMTSGLAAAAWRRFAAAQDRKPVGSKRGWALQEKCCARATFRH